MNNKEQSAINALQELIADEYGLAIHWYNLWCRKVAEREIKRSLKALPQGEKTHYELKISPTPKSFNLYWQKVFFVQLGAKKKRLTEHMAFNKNKNINSYYSPSSFSKASEWELDLINDIESRITPIRNRLKHLSSMLRSLSYYNKCSGLVVTYKPIDELIDLSEKRSIVYYKKRGAI